MDDLKGDIFNTNIMYLQGAGPKKAELLLKELEIATFKDLLYYFPFRYIDRTRFYTVEEIAPDLPYVQLYGEIVSAKIEGQMKGKKRLVMRLADDTGSIELVFFQGLTWIKEKIRPGQKYVVFGKPSVFNGQINIVHPEIDSTETENKNSAAFSTNINGIYSSTEKLRNSYMGNKAIVKLVSNLLGLILHKIPETLPDYILNRYRLLPLPEALLNIHFPQSQELLVQARNRLKFDELFYIQLGILHHRTAKVRTGKGFVFDRVGERFRYFFEHNLPFSLTGAQKRVVREMRQDMGSGRQMNRLLQGDVGSGKTLVALMIMLIAADNGFQSCIMAPTEILAVQHYTSVVQFLKEMDVRVRLLTGSTKKSERATLCDELAEGKIDILIGTHALIEDGVQFKKLGLAVIDEQHRFGVEQRAKLWGKSETLPHVLVMTATPIPRTLAMTVYGDLDVSVIDELPPGRKPVKTLLFNDSKRLRVFGFMKEQIRQGRQIYVVYPLIKESESMDYKYLEDGYESIVRAFPPPEYVTVVVHGKMKAADKDFSMNQFVSGNACIMVATSVIEVGVNVPNASVMIIESAERFGLAQLHQLRGRVGRGADQSYCLMMAGYKLSKESRKRMELMVSTCDGFKIAEEDMKMRGPGDIEGTQQSGLPFKLRITDLSKDGELLEAVRKVVESILQKDPDLSLDENKVLKSCLENAGSQKKFSKIS
ncbi:MAG: ATP-dependent DNA helicase RecG [Prevotellaceae bacterium]|jgi:ATP-dependent DNA helicase RecG|nr:ATP-dependent DNA helicase RecG [Prevotellaceae bacterium]